MKLGFTLMELLVVIVIISLLAAMMFPVFGRIQERGREVKCASNLRQLHTAAMNYVNNHGEGRLPVAASEKVYDYDPSSGEYRTWWRTGWVDSYPSQSDSGRSYWWEAGQSNGTYCIQQGSLFPYLGDAGDESVYVCPTMALKARSVMTDSEEQVVTRSYGMNMDLSRAVYSNIDGLSRKILFADQGFEQMAGASQYLADTADSTDDDEPEEGAEGTQRFSRGIDGSIDFETQSGDNKADTLEYLGELHGRQPGQDTGMANVIFADGHVEKVGYINTEYVCLGDWEYGQPIQ